MKCLTWQERAQTGSRLVLLVLVFLLPLIVIPWTNDAWEQSKLAAAATLTLLAVLCWFASAVWGNKVTLRWSLPIILLTSFTVWATLSGLWNNVGYGGWVGLHGQYASSLLSLWILTILGWIWTQTMDEVWNARALRALTVSLAIGVGISLLIILAQIYAWSWFSELRNPLTDDQLELGIFLVVGFFLFLFRWKEISAWARWLPFIFLVISSGILILLDLTVAWIALGGGLGIALFRGWKQWSGGQKVFLAACGLLAIAGVVLPLQSWFFTSTYDPLPYFRIAGIVSLDQPGKSMVLGYGPQQGVRAFSRTMVTAQGDGATAFSLFPEDQRVLSFSSHLLDLYFGVGIVGVLLLLGTFAFAFGDRLVGVTKSSTDASLQRHVLLVVFAVALVGAPLSFLLMVMFVLIVVNHPIGHERSVNWSESSLGRALAVFIFILSISLGVMAMFIGGRMTRAAVIAKQARSDITSQSASLDIIERNFAAARRLDPRHPEYRLDQVENLIVQGQLASREGQQDVAESHFANALVLVDEVLRGPIDLVLLDAAYRLNVGIAQFSDRFGEEFRRLLFTGQVWEPSSPLWFERLGELNLAMFQSSQGSRPELLTEALDVYRKAKLLNPNRIEPLLGQSRVKEAQGELTASMALLTEGLQTHDDDADLPLELGRLQRLSGKTDEAIATFEGVNQRYGDQSMALLHLEQLFEMKGEVEQQKNLLTRLLMLEPENGEARVKLDRLSSGE